MAQFINTEIAQWQVSVTDVGDGWCAVQGDCILCTDPREMDFAGPKPDFLVRGTRYEVLTSLLESDYALSHHDVDAHSSANGTTFTVRTS